MKHLAILFIGFISACSILNSSSTNSQEPLLIIDNDSVTVEEFLYAFEKNRPEDSTVYKSEVDEYLDLYIKFKLKVSEAKNRGMDTSVAFIKEYDSYKDQLDNSYLQSSNDTDTLLREAFARLQEEVNASHILFMVEESALAEDTLKVYEKALAVRDSIINDNISFEEMAVNYSEDPSAKQNKGNLGYFSVFQMVYPFETAAFTTPIDSISMPTRTRFGYHLIKVNNRRKNEGKIRVAHIMIRKGQNDEERAYDVYKQLMADGDWAELCKQNSEDGQSAARGGELAPFSRGQIVASFADAAFNLTNPEEITEPILTPYGWHIIKLIEKLPVDNYETEEKQLLAQIRRDSRAQISKQKMYQRIAAENGFKENNSNIYAIINPENHRYAKNRWSFEGDSLSNLELFIIAGKNYTASALYKYIAKSNRQQNSKEFLFEQYNNFKNESLLDFEKSQLANKYPEYRYLSQEYYDGILLFSIMEEEIWDRAATDSVGLATYYQSHNNDYIDSTSIDAIIYSSTEEDKIDSIAQFFTHLELDSAIKEVEKELLNTENNTDTQLSLQLEQGEFNIDQHPVVSQLKSPLNKQKIFIEKKWYYVVVTRDPSEPKKMDKIKGQLIAKYQQELEQGWLDELRSRYLVTVNEKVLVKLEKQLEAK